MPRALVPPAPELLHDLVDALPAPAVLCAASGHIVHESAAFGRLMCGEPMASRLRTAVGAATRVLIAPVHRAHAALASPGDTYTCQVQGSVRRYDVCGALVASQRHELRGAAAVFLVHAAVPRPLSDEELHDRFRLTAREVEVLRLLAVGRSAREVANALGLSYFTARHHVEHVLGKLGVRSRAAVAAATGR